MIRIASFAAAALIAAAIAAPAQAGWYNGLAVSNGIFANGHEGTNGLRDSNGLSSNNGLTTHNGNYGQNGVQGGNGPAAPTPVTMHGITLPGGATLSLAAR